MDASGELGDPHLDAYIDFLLVEKGLAAKTLEAYSQDLVRFLDFIRTQGTPNLADVDSAQVLQYLIHLRKAGLGARSRARHLISLRGLYRHLVHDKVIQQNPAAVVDLPKVGLKLPDVLSVADVRALPGSPCGSRVARGPQPRPDRPAAPRQGGPRAPCGSPCYSALRATRRPTVLSREAGQKGSREALRQSRAK